MTPVPSFVLLRHFFQDEDTAPCILDGKGGCQACKSTADYHYIDLFIPFPGKCGRTLRLSMEYGCSGYAGSRNSSLLKEPSTADLILQPVLYLGN
jgi:hypothetical protein